MTLNQSNRPERYKHTASLSAGDIGRHRLLLNWFKQYHRRYSCKMNWPPEVLSILDNVSDLCFVPAFVLAWTCCRSAEIKQVKIEHIICGCNFPLKSSKSKHVRLISPLFSFKKETLQRIHPKTLMSVVSYDQLRRSIKNAREKAEVELPEGALNCTHIFRHLIASHLSAENVPITDIANKLGHSSEKTTLQYIHNK